jgi:hypothetical protein
MGGLACLVRPHDFSDSFSEPLWKSIGGGIPVPRFGTLPYSESITLLNTQHYKVFCECCQWFFINTLIVIKIFLDVALVRRLPVW